MPPGQDRAKRGAMRKVRIPPDLAAAMDEYARNAAEDAPALSDEQIRLLSVALAQQNPADPESAGF